MKGELAAMRRRTSHRGTRGEKEGEGVRIWVGIVIGTVLGQLATQLWIIPWLKGLR